MLRQYELLLVHNKRFALADAIVSIQRVLQALQDAQNVMQTHTSTTSNFGGKASQRSHTHASKRATFQDVMDAIAKRFVLLEAQIPVFLGERVRRAQSHACIASNSNPVCA